MHLLWLYYTAIVKERTSALIYCVAIIKELGPEMKEKDGIIRGRYQYDQNLSFYVTLPDQMYSALLEVLENADKNDKTKIKNILSEYKNRENGIINPITQ